MKFKINSVLFLAICIFIYSCKKEEQNSVSPITEASIIGLWEVKLFTVTQYDTNNVFISNDTVVFTNEVGEPIIFMEKFTSDNKFFRFENTINDTLTQSNYTQSGDNIIINLPSNGFPFNNRLITSINSSTLVLSQMFNTMPKQKWTQIYIRK
ncbi:MAG: hypothetical protein ACOYO1_15770 [Bacteroidales bacterium]